MLNSVGIYDIFLSAMYKSEPLEYAKVGLSNERLINKIWGGIDIFDLWPRTVAKGVDLSMSVLVHVWTR